MTTDTELHRACAELRFAEGLRRRSAEARAEASIWEACALARLEGARVEPQQLREQIMIWDEIPTGEKQISADLALGVAAWRAVWAAVSALPELNSQIPGQTPQVPLRSLLARVQRDYGSILAAWGMADKDKVSIPRDPERWGQILARHNDEDGDAVIRVAHLWGALLADEPFEVGNSIVGVVASKYLLAQEGVEPTAVSVLSRLAGESPNKYRAALHQIRVGEWEPWVDFVRESIIRGCREGIAITRHVQAAKLG